MVAETTIIEERNKFMINNTTKIPTFRIAHFIKPTLSAFSEVPKPPKIESLSLLCKPRVYFRGTPSPLDCWKSWVERLELKHESAWRKAGIFDAIKGSSYHIEKQTDLLLCLAEKWCPESNTFVFPWGEASITVEDVMVLGGFSPLGDSVISSSSVVDEVEERLINWRKQIGVGSRSKTDVIQRTWIEWTECFMGRGDELEHAAFLALWLSRHVFMTKSSKVIRPIVFSIAARLSRGVKIAIAPAVLAIIYRELRLLKEKLIHCSEYPYDVDSLQLVAPFHLVQLWVWERFPRLAPVPKMLSLGEPILARWEGVRIRYMGLKTELDSAGETFRWRPYAQFVDNWSFLSFYDDMGQWVFIDLDEKWEMFDVCLRGCELQGLDCEEAENYNPHRVARQFGFDQEIPCSFPKSSNVMLRITSPEPDQLVTMTKLYVPSRSFQGEVTVRYARWWKGESLLEKNDPLRVYSRRKLRSHTLSLSTLCPQSSQPVEFRMLEYGGWGKKMEQTPKKRLRLCEHRNVSRSDDLPSMLNTDQINKGVATDLVSRSDHEEEGGTVGDFDSLILLPLECKLLENGDLGNKMEQKPNKRLRLCEHRNDTRSDDLASMVNTEKINKGVVTDLVSIRDAEEEGGTVGGYESLVLPVECKLLKNGDLGNKMEQKPMMLLQCQNDSTSGDLPSLVKGKVNEIISISDDEEEAGAVETFESLVSDIEKRISKLEKVVYDHHQMQINIKTADH